MVGFYKECEKADEPITLSLPSELCYRTTVHRATGVAVGCATDPVSTTCAAHTEDHGGRLVVVAQ